MTTAGPKTTSARFCETRHHPPALVTTSATELKVWLAQFLGKRLAHCTPSILDPKS